MLELEFKKKWGSIVRIMLWPAHGVVISFFSSKSFFKLSLSLSFMGVKKCSGSWKFCNFMYIKPQQEKTWDYCLKFLMIYFYSSSPPQHHYHSSRIYFSSLIGMLKVIISHFQLAISNLELCQKLWDRERCCHSIEAYLWERMPCFWIGFCN